MKITITNDGIEVTDALKKHILDKFKRLERMINKTAEVHVTLSLENLEQIVKTLIHAHGTEFYAKAESEDLYVAIDILIDKLEDQITKHKGKIKEKRRDKSEDYGENTNSDNSEEY